MSVVMATSLSAVSGDWLLTTATRSTDWPGRRKSPVCTAWMWTLRSATSWTAAEAPATAGTWAAVWESWPLPQPVNTRLAARAPAARAATVVERRLSKRFTQSLLLGLVAVRLCRVVGRLGGRKRRALEVARGSAVRSFGALCRVPKRSVPCTNSAFCQPPLFACGAPDLHRCSARVEAAC